jgi:protocatechuate 3,4-dioxygenase beta subunit
MNRIHPRRALLKAMAAAGVAGLLPGLSNLARAQAPLVPTSACEEPTSAQTEGPYFSPNSPQRSNLREKGMAGTPIVLTGLVLSRSCVPLPNVLVELWHADETGAYDNEGYRLRGHQFTGADGIYRFATIVPGRYPGRTRHFHAKFQAPSQPILTTQFYFPNEPDNSQDWIFSPDLLLEIAGGPEKTARFDVVLDIA